MSKKILFSDIKQVEFYREKIINATNKHMDELLQSGKNIDFLRKVKFEQSGYDPLFEHETNFIEQVNQTFTYLVCIEAVEYLLIKYPTQKFNVNFGTEAGHDVESENGSIICECFAATNPKSNQKLKLDMQKVSRNEQALKKYVIFFAENKELTYVENLRKKYQEIEIIAIDKI